MNLTRRTFCSRAAAITAASLVTPVLLAQTPAASAPPVAGAAPSKSPPPKPPMLAADLVRETVSQSHRSIEKVRELVAATPLLVNACWDWGGGDFETALQAAAHTGRREIAEFLLSRGARPDLFASAMLGQLEMLKAALALDPNAHGYLGPHGFTLLHCAKQGGEKAKAVYDYLLSVGAPDKNQLPLPYVWPGGAAPAT
jgi:hypothetical protein